jgi:4-hydroxybenzoate polyprenyltransferase
LALPGEQTPQLYAGLPLNLAQVTALTAIPLVALYPAMKRITWWPQIWLGLVFSWGVLVAGAAIHGALRLEIWLTYAGCVIWTIAYDTIYALQDKEDDALIGVRSSARRLGAGWRGFVVACYCAALFLLAAGLYVASAQAAPAIALGLIGAFLIWPLVNGVQDNAPASALTAFRGNETVGWAFVVLCMAIPAWITFSPA